MPDKQLLGALVERFLFQGSFCEEDGETELSHYLFREYDAKIGRWNATDHGSVVANVWRGAGMTIPKAVSVRLSRAQGSTPGLSAVFNPATATWDAVWPNVLPADAPVGVSGQGYVTTIDRVFFRLNGTNLERIQCFGDPDPGSANWPNLATNTLPGTLASTPAGGALNECTAAEVIAKNVASVAFAYADGTGTVTATKNLIRRIDWTIKLRKTVNNRTVEQDVVGTVAVRNPT